MGPSQPGQNPEKTVKIIWFKPPKNGVYHHLQFCSAKCFKNWLTTKAKRNYVCMLINAGVDVASVGKGGIRVVVVVVDVVCNENDNLLFLLLWWEILWCFLIKEIWAFSDVKVFFWVWIIQTPMNWTAKKAYLVQKQRKTTSSIWIPAAKRITCVINRTPQLQKQHQHQQQKCGQGQGQGRKHHQQQQFRQNEHPKREKQINTKITKAQKNTNNALEDISLSPRQYWRRSSIVRWQLGVWFSLAKEKIQTNVSLPPHLPREGPGDQIGCFLGWPARWGGRPASPLWAHRAQWGEIWLHQALTAIP